jgi:hypothetical protein
MRILARRADTGHDRVNSTNFRGLTSPQMQGPLTRMAKGGAAKKRKKKAILSVMIVLPHPMMGALGAEHALATKGRR